MLHKSNETSLKALLTKKNKHIRINCLVYTDNKMNRLRYMAVFAHIVKAGSITKAADDLSLSKSVVSQHLKALEQSLGVTLLKRTTRRQSLTTAGQAFFDQCEAMNSLVDDAWQHAQQSLVEPQGKIKITAPNALMGALVAPAIAEVLLKYPNLQYELIASDSHLDLHANNIDLAVRVGLSEQSSLKQQRIGEFRDVLCCSKPNKPKDLRKTAYVANHWQGRHIEHQFVKRHKNEKLTYNPAKISATADSFNTCLSLIESGAGIGLVPEFVLRQTQTTVMPVLPEYDLPVNPVYVLHPYNKNKPLSVSVSIEAIAALL